MEASIEIESILQQNPKPAFARKYAGLICWSLLIILLALGAVALDFTGGTPLHKGEVFKFQAAIMALVVINFGIISWYVIGRLKKDDASLEGQADEIQNLKTELYHVNVQNGNTKADLEYANNQLSNTLFQLSNANLQFDIITSELDAAKRETDAIFANVRQGLFLLAPDGTIGAQTSEELKAIFQTTELARRNFLNLLRPLLPEKRHKTISDYFDILFDARKNDKQLQRFNPLKRVELNFPSPDGGFLPKHVEFSFQRIINNGTVPSVMVSALDVTERVKLEEQLREGEALREKQLELLFEILQVESGPLRRFIENAGDAITKINSVFMETGATGGDALHDKVQRVFRTAHNLKSEAAALNLLLFEKTIHQIEDQLNELRRNPALVNEDLLNVLVSIANFQNQLKDAAALIEKISGLRRSFGPEEGASAGDRTMTGNTLPEASPTDELKKVVEDLCRTITARRGKQARIEWEVNGFDELPAKHRRLLQNAIFQLVRNSLVHGIELPDERTRAGKDPCGCIKVVIAPIPGTEKFTITCRDDGAGLDANEIRSRAVQEGLIKEEKGRELTENDLYALIFEPGFSTASVSEDAGRGVGLDVIREEIVDQLHGEIHIEFSAHHYCEFGFTVPKA